MKPIIFRAARVKYDSWIGLQLNNFLRRWLSSWFCHSQLQLQFTCWRSGWVVFTNCHFCISCQEVIFENILTLFPPDILRFRAKTMNQIQGKRQGNRVNQISYFLKLFKPWHIKSSNYLTNKRLDTLIDENACVHYKG